MWCVCSQIEIKFYRGRRDQLGQMLLLGHEYEDGELTTEISNLEFIGNQFGWSNEDESLVGVGEGN